MISKTVPFFLLLLLMLSISTAFSQKCDSSFFANSITGDHNEGISITTLCRNQQNEIINTGSFAYGTYFSRAWISKSTSKGNIIWSRQYSNPKFDNIGFNRILPQPDGSSLITGTLYKLDASTRIDIDGILFLKIDNFGKVVWSKLIDSHHSVSHNSYNMGDIIQTSNGDFIMTIIVVKDDFTVKYYSSVIVMRVNISGEIKWAKKISSGSFMMGNYGFSLSNTDYNTVTQLPGGNIIFGTVLDDYDYTTGNITKEAYYFNELDFNTGNLNWENAYSLPSSSIGPLTGMQKITPLPNGDLSFFGDIFQQSASPKINRRPVNIITDSRGNLKNAFSYYNSNTNADCDLAAVFPSGNGNQQILMTENILNTGVIFSVNKDGSLLNQAGFKGPSSSIGPLARALFPAKQGYYFASNDKTLNEIHLFNADTSGTLACVNRQVKIITESATSLFTKTNANVQVDIDASADFLDGGIIGQNYNMHSVTDCNIVTCCNDVIDPPLIFNLCEGSSVTLPDNTVVKDSGNYYATYKTALGCDSVALYKVVALKSLSSIKITPDTCLNSSGFVTLHASGDFDTYYWMNIPTNEPAFTVSSPGTYFVKATNSCGSIIDSVHVYEKCDFPVLMPNAFTPNKDGINELFRIPPQNLNKLISFRIYNRFGKLVFETKDIDAGWNGTFKNKPQPVGVYVYYLEMQSFNGKQIKLKGTVTLLRQ